MPGLTLLGPRDQDKRIAVLTFVLDGVPHDLVAAILGYEHGIGVRAGLFCAHQGVQRLLRAVAPASREVGAPSGAVRASIGLYNTPDEIDALAEALESIASGGGGYRYARDHSGDYCPVGWPREDAAS